MSSRRPLRPVRSFLAISQIFAIALLTGCGGGSTGNTGGSGTPSNPTPALSSISPTTATAGAAATTLTATGTGFISSSVVEWNGTALATTFTSSTSLTAQVPSNDLASAGTPSVTIVNPAPGGGTSGSQTFTINAPSNPAPTASVLSPASATAGGSAFTLTVTGKQFLSTSQVLWNGTARPTTFSSSSSLTAQISATDVSIIGTATVSVTTPSPGGGTSNAINFPIDFSLSADTSNVAVLDLEGTDLIWDSQRNKIYVAVPGAASTKANTITIVDPVAGIIGGSQSTGSNPGTLALSDDGQYLYASIAGDLAVQRFVLPALSPDIKWTLGTDPITQQAYIPVDVKVQPSAAHTVAVIQADQSLENPEVAVYDDGLMRSKISPSIDCNYSSLQWNSGGSGIFSEDTTSDRALCVLSVNASGASFQTSFGMAFRAIGARLHLDSQSGYVYSDPGEVVNTSTGVPVGNNTTHRSSSTSPILSAFDSNLKRVFFISTDQNSSGQNEFLLQVFDQTQFTLLGSFVIPNAVGTPANFIRWGNSGLAFVTNNLNGVNPSSGQLYLLDGPFVNPSGTLDSAIGSALNPVPTLLSVSPLSSEVGGSDVQIRITGRDFAGPPAVYWNNTALTTTLISETEVQAIIPAADLAAVGQASLTVLNSSPGGGSSNFLPFSINPPASASNRIAVFGTGGNDLVWDSTAQKIYVSVPSIQGGLGNTIAIVDPVAGTVSSTPFIGSDPAKLAISSDDQYLYVGLNGANSVQRFILPGLTPDISWHLGADSFDGPYYALDLLAAPGSPHTTAVSTAEFDVSPSSTGITIYDDTTPRPTVAPGWNTADFAYASTQWGSDASTLYVSEQAFPTDFYSLAVTASGVSVTKDYPGALTFSFSDFGIHFDAGTGLIYTDGGQVVNPATAAVVGNFNASGIAIPDSTLGRVYFIGQTTAQAGTTSFTIQAFDQQKFTLLDSIVVSNVIGVPTAVIRWGVNGLAFTTRVGAVADFYDIGPGQLYVVSGQFVKPASTNIKKLGALFSEHVHNSWASSKGLNGPTLPAPHRFRESDR